ncbi:MAG: MFS transporter [Gammaproteobacteria bacterium]|nr:MFS transporter [Gammaproteobacteria bacterium]
MHEENFRPRLSRIMPDMQTTNPMPWRLVIAGCIGMFAATATGSTRAPFLPDMAAELNVSLPAIANLFGLTATVWGISSYIVGSASDRFGRRIFLIVSPVCLALTMLAASQASSYSILAFIIVLAAICCGSYTATALAEVSLRTHSSHQGRALGYVMSGQSLTLLIGIPVAAMLGSRIGWRGTHVALAGLALVAAVSMVLTLYTSVKAKTSSVHHQAHSRNNLRLALTGPIVRLFMALAAERVCFGLSTFYYASYLRTAYELPVSAVAMPLALFAGGNIVGTVLGGQVADRFAYRRISFAVALICAGVIAIPWFLLQSSLTITISLGVAFAFFNALSKPPLMAAMADVPADVRGVIMGLNSSIASIGWMTAALMGGWLYSGIGFVGFGPVMAVMCFVAALIVIPDSRIRTRQNVG